MLYRRRRSVRSSQCDGQSLVEFALVMPLMLILLLAIVDVARIYTTMMSVESAAREAADFGTTLGAAKWEDATYPATVAEMKRRACVAAGTLPDYAGAADGSDCTNPSFAYCLTPGSGVGCGPVDPINACDDPDRTNPCELTVTLTYNFHLMAPLNIEVLGTRIGIPSVLAFERDSTFAMTDIDLGGTAP